jgi:hypothetical protein
MVATTTGNGNGAATPARNPFKHRVPPKTGKVKEPPKAKGGGSDGIPEECRDLAGHSSPGEWLRDELDGVRHFAELARQYAGKVSPGLKCRAALRLMQIEDDLADVWLALEHAAEPAEAARDRAPWLARMPAGLAAEVCWKYKDKPGTVADWLREQFGLIEYLSAGPHPEIDKAPQEVRVWALNRLALLDGKLDNILHVLANGELPGSEWTGSRG